MKYLLFMEKKQKQKDFTLCYNNRKKQSTLVKFLPHDYIYNVYKGHRGSNHIVV